MCIKSNELSCLQDFWNIERAHHLLLFLCLLVPYYWFTDRRLKRINHFYLTDLYLYSTTALREFTWVILHKVFETKFKIIIWMILAIESQSPNYHHIFIFLKILKNICLFHQISFTRIRLRFLSKLENRTNFDWNIDFCSILSRNCSSSWRFQSYNWTQNNNKLLIKHILEHFCRRHGKHSLDCCILFAHFHTQSRARLPFLLLSEVFQFPMRFLLFCQKRQQNGSLLTPCAEGI